MIKGAMAQRIAYAVGKVVARQVVDELGGKVVKLTYDLTEAVGEVILEEYGPKGKAAPQNGTPTSSDIVSVMASMSSGDVTRSIDAALASPDMRHITASMTLQEKDGLRQRAIRGLFDFGFLFKFAGRFEASATAEQNRSGEKAEDSSREAELRDKLGPLRAELVLNLEQRNDEQVRAAAIAILGKLSSDREELVSLLRRLDEAEARGAADGRETSRPDAKAERVGSEKDARVKLAMLRSELLRSLMGKDYERMRTHANAILAISPTDPQALGFLQRLDEVEARAAVEAPSTDRLDEKAERVRGWAVARVKLGMLRSELLRSLFMRDNERVRAHANAILAISTTERDELVALLQGMDETEASAAAAERLL